jgi:hypothetical protein
MSVRINSGTIETTANKNLLFVFTMARFEVDLQDRLPFNLQILFDKQFYGFQLLRGIPYRSIILTEENSVY